MKLQFVRSQGASTLLKELEAFNLQKLNFQEYLKTDQEKRKKTQKFRNYLRQIICEKRHGRWDYIVREARTAFGEQKERFQQIAESYKASYEEELYKEVILSMNYNKIYATLKEEWKKKKIN